jgi:hypothetical protein
MRWQAVNCNIKESEGCSELSCQRYCAAGCVTTTPANDDAR